MRSLALLVILLTASLATAAAPSPAGVTIPELRVGDVFEREHKSWSNHTAEPAYSSRTVRSYPHDLETVDDVFGTPRLAIRSLFGFACAGCSTNQQLVEANTGNAIYSLSEDETATMAESLPENALVQVSHRERAAAGDLFYRLGPGDLSLLRGRTLEPGDVFQQTTPRLFGLPERTVVLQAVGWETTPYGALFRVDVSYADEQSVTSHWFAEGNPYPIHSRGSHVASSTTFYGASHQLSFLPGSGAILADPAYVPPPYADGMLRTTLGADGPADEPGTHLALADATRLLRLHPLGSVFFAQHPSAYLFDASFTEFEGTTTWELSYVDGSEGMSARVVGAGGLGAAHVTRTTGSGPAIPAAEVIGKRAACWDELSRMFAEAPGHEAPREGSFEVFQHGDNETEVWCELTRQASRALPPSIGIALGRPQGRVSAALYGLSGERWGLSWDVASTERAVAVASLGGG